MASLICVDCRLVQPAASRCRACGGAGLRTPSDAGLLQLRRAEPLERVNWRSMSLRRLVITLAVFVIFLPVEVYSLTGSRLLEVVALVGALFSPYLAALASPALRLVTQLRGTKRLAPAPQPLALPPAGELRRGVARSSGQLVEALDGRPCLAVLLRARDWRGTYLWQLAACEFEVVDEEGARLHVAGSLVLEGDAQPLGEREAASALEALGLPADVVVPGTLEILRISDGDTVTVRGAVGREQHAATFRESAEREVMRGAPGHPVHVRRRHLR